MASKSTDSKDDAIVSALMDMHNTPLVFDANDSSPSPPKSVDLTIAQRRSKRHVNRTFPVGLHVAYKSNTSREADLRGVITVEAAGKSPAMIVPMGTKTPVPVSLANIELPSYQVGDEVQVIDTHSTASPDGPVTYWYDAIVQEVIDHGKENLKLVGSLFQWAP